MAFNSIYAAIKTDNAPKCRANGCESPSRADGLCPKHRWRLKKYGSFDLPPQKTIAEKFWEKVARSDDLDSCWPWMRGCSEDGYGFFSFNYRTYFAHRVAWELTNGPLHSGVLILHSCDNPPCCNPKHLSPGTHLQNMRDKARKGRTNMPKGTDHYRARLTAESVQKIREIATEDISISKLAREFGVSRTTIEAVIARRTWKHLI